MTRNLFVFVFVVFIVGFSLCQVDELIDEFPIEPVLQAGNYTPSWRLYGINYGVRRDLYSCFTSQEVYRDLQLLKRFTSRIRIFGMCCQRVTQCLLKRLRGLSV
jgi:hypothetical protein